MCFTYHHAKRLNLDPMAFSIQVLELAVVARNDATLPLRLLAFEDGSNKVARVNVQVTSNIRVLSKS